jgi:hypothetical protein
MENTQPPLFLLLFFFYTSSILFSHTNQQIYATNHSFMCWQTQCQNMFGCKL